ncbi:radical SAM protein [Marinitoga sp. 1197]|uniref:radical SAM/SPASM domain-containing protein n=1 Tax=Marinitoga sp. 1197 TaxID=1428449 RepID=UPI0006580238|nr:radical SAM protein [Marinitoga sp. 1197]KLO24416.1 radical SAM protein [Marinitoga sp. 1197]
MKNFIANINNTYGIYINFQKSPKYRSLIIKDNYNIYPKVASIELTNKCNIKCLHCYGDFNSSLNNFISLNDAKKILYELKNLGVNIIELTGGEITTYPFLKKIITYALELEFKQIGLLTNGIYISEEIMNTIILNKSKIFIQIDLHSLNDEYLKWFTKTSNSLNEIKNNIYILAKNKVNMRVATIVTPKNLDEIEEIADWVYNLGIKSFGISPVIELGRAKNMNKNLYLNDNEYIQLDILLDKINKKYPKFLSLIEFGQLKNSNCGCISSHVVISATGEIKMCTMDNMKYFNSNLGNAIKQNIKNIYDINSKYINDIFNLESPKLNSEECKECKYRYFCNGCLLRGFIKAKELKNNCKWYKNKVSQIIKEQLRIEEFQR